MKGSEILSAVLQNLGSNPNQLAKELKMSRTQGLYDILDDTVGVSKKMADKIVERYPQFNKNFLLTGEGLLLREDINDFIISKLAKSEATQEILIEMIAELLQPDDTKRVRLLNALNSKVQDKISLIRSGSSMPEQKRETDDNIESFENAGV